MINKIRNFILNYKNIPVEVKASICYTICSIIQNCIAFLTLPIFTRVLSESQYGQYSIYRSWISIIIIFATLNLQYGSFNTAMIKFEDDQDKYISAIQGICTSLTLGLFIIYLLAMDFWNKLLSMPTILIITMFIEMLSTTVIAFWTNKKRFEYRYKPMVFVTLLIAILSPAVGIAAVLSVREKGIARIVSNAMVYACIAIIIYIYHLYKGKAFFDKRYWIYALKFNLPLIPYYLSQSIFNQSDKIMIERLVSLNKAGIYSLAYQASVIINFVINAINSSFVPWLYRKIKVKDFDSTKKISNILVILISLMLVMIILFGPELIMILGGKKYQEAIWIIPPVTSSLLFLFLSQLSINIMFYYEDNTSLIKGSILSAILNIVLNYICIPIFGYVAAGYTTLLAYIVFWICNLYYMDKVCMKKICGYHRKMLFDYSYLIKFAVIFCIICVSLTFTYIHVIMRIVLVLSILIVCYIKRRMIFNILKTLKS